MNYRDFFKETNKLVGGKGDNVKSKDIDPKQLAMGIKVEMEHTKDAKLAKEIAEDHLSEDPHYYSKLNKAGLADELKKNEDGSLKISRLQGAVAIPKIVAAVGFSDKPASGELCGMTAVPSVDKVQTKPVQGKVDASLASKSVGGPVVPGEGQKQGGPNTKGCIANTPKNSKILSADNKKQTPKTTLREKKFKNALKPLIREVLSEMKYDRKNEVWIAEEGDPVDDYTLNQIGEEAEHLVAYRDPDVTEQEVLAQLKEKMKEMDISISIPVSAATPEVDPDAEPGEEPVNKPLDEDEFLMRIIRVLFKKHKNPWLEEDSEMGGSMELQADTAKYNQFLSNLGLTEDDLSYDAFLKIKEKFRNRPELNN